MDSNSFLLIFMVLAVAALFFMNSRARKRQTAANAFRDHLQPGQEVMTTSGMFATVVDVEDDRVTLQTAGGQQAQWLKVAIARLVEDEAEAVEAEETAEAEETDPTDGGVQDAPVDDPSDTPRDDTSR